MSNLTNKSNANNIFLKTYPIGSIYVSTSNTNPSTIFDGTWVTFGTGRTLVGVDSNQTEFATVEKTGRENKHTLTIYEMPSHSHDVGSNQDAGGSWQTFYRYFNIGHTNTFVNR